MLEISLTIKSKLMVLRIPNKYFITQLEGNDAVY